MKTHLNRFFLIIALTVIATLIALPKQLPINFNLFNRDFSYTISAPIIDFTLFGKNYYKEFELKKGLDIQGGIQIVLEADMSEIAQEDQEEALIAAREIILRRVDLYGLAEPNVKTFVTDESQRIIVELPGIDNPEDALSLVGQTAQLEFGLIGLPEDATAGAEPALLPTGLTGAQLKRANVQSDPQTGEPIVSIDFNEEGREIFADITTNHTGEQLAILIDGYPIMAPTIQVPIVTGQATITGGFTFEEAQNLKIQLNAGALPVPIRVLEQRNVNASLGQESVEKSLIAGGIGIVLVMLFMILYYGLKGVIASIALLIYAILTTAIYKLIGVTLTLPGIAGLILSIGMAVDANILIFERMKEELRLNKPFNVALELGFGRAWDSIKDANLATIITALILINPMEFSFLNSGGMVRGFGITLLIGVLLSLFTGVVVTRTLMRVFLKGGK
jgi:preprotein translocase subunit SecD